MNKQMKLFLWKQIKNHKEILENLIETLKVLKKFENFIKF